MSETNGHSLRAAVIGTGKISEEHLRFLSTASDIKLVGVCDLSPSLAKYAATRFKSENAYTDVGQMFDAAKPQVVHLCTPAHTHVKLVTDCLNAGAHVIVEKPVAPTNAEFRQLWEIAEKNKRVLVEDHNYRFNESILRMEQALSEGALGEVSEVEVRMVLNICAPGGRYVDANLPHPSHNLPCGVIHEFITHLCYLALRFIPADQQIEKICAAWRKLGDSEVLRHDDLDVMLIAGDVHGRIRFTSHASPDAFNVIVRGTRGWMETDLFQPQMRRIVPRAGGPQLSPLVNQLSNGWGLMRSSVVGLKNKVMQRTPYEGLRTFLQRTYSAIRSGYEPPVTFDDMDCTTRLIDAIASEANRV